MLAEHLYRPAVPLTTCSSTLDKQTHVYTETNLEVTETELADLSCIFK